MLLLDLITAMAFGEEVRVVVHVNGNCRDAYWELSPQPLVVGI